MSTEETGQPAYPLIDLLVFPAVLINRSGVVLSANKSCLSEFSCSSEACVCNRNPLPLRTQPGILCDTFYSLLIELLANFPEQTHVEFSRNGTPWKIVCKNFDTETFLLYAIEQKYIDDAYRNIHMLVGDLPVESEGGNPFGSQTRQGVIEIKLAEIEHSINRAFFMIQNNQVVYANHLFFEEFNLSIEHAGFFDVEELLGRPLHFFQSLAQDKSNLGPLVIDLVGDPQKRSFRIMVKNIVFQQKPALVVILHRISTPVKPPKLQAVIEKFLGQGLQVNWDQVNIDLNVLYVEDKAINQKIVKILLNSIGCCVDLANNGQEGIQKLQQNTYDIILMDIQMPVMDGLMASKLIQQTFENPPPIIAVTANHEFLDELDIEDYGIKDVIAKPFLPELLYQKVLYWVQ